MPAPLTKDDFLPARVFTGSCHCGETKYLIRLALFRNAVDPSDPPYELLRKEHPEATGPPIKHLRIYKCNCTVCHKAGIFHLRLADAANDFVILAPLSVASLGLYRCNAKESSWYFCKTCGVRCFTLAGPHGLENAAVDLEGWKAEGDDGGRAGGGDAKKATTTTEVLRPTAEFYETGRPGTGSDYLSINAVTLDAGQEGLDLREWSEKGWIAYGDALDRKGGFQFTGPHAGGLY